MTVFNSRPAYFLIASTISFGIFCCGAAATWGSEARQVPSIFSALADQTKSKDMALINLCLKVVHGPICWDIPRAYLRFPPNWNGGVQDVILVNAALRWTSPDLSPPALVSSDSPPDDSVEIHISPSANFFVRSHWMRDVLPRLAEKGGDAEFRVYEYAKVNGRVPLDSVIFVPRDAAEVTIYFECMRNGINFGHRLTNCAAYTDVRDDVTIDYIFNSQNLPNWRDVDDRVRRLLASLLVP